MHAEDELNAIAAQDFAESIAQRSWLAREYVRTPCDEHHFAAETTNCLRHLDADCATA
jgi:hypothetical protein